MSEIKFDNSGVRRQDRLLDRETSMELLKTAEYGVLSMCDGDQPYGIPINYVWDGANALYLHCAPEGRKLRILASNPRISFTIVGRVNLLPERFTTEYQSLVLTGTAAIDLPEDERHHALDLLLDKLSPAHKTVGLKYAAASFHRVSIIRLDITTLSAKSKHIH